MAPLLPALRAARRPGPPIATSFTDAVATRVVEAVRGPDRTAPPEAARALARLERLPDAVARARLRLVLLVLGLGSLRWLECLGAGLAIRAWLRHRTPSARPTAARPLAPPRADGQSHRWRHPPAPTDPIGRALVGAGVPIGLAGEIAGAPRRRPRLAWKSPRTRPGAGGSRPTHGTRPGADGPGVGRMAARGPDGGRRGRGRARPREARGLSPGGTGSLGRVRGDAPRLPQRHDPDPLPELAGLRVARDARRHPPGGRLPARPRGAAGQRGTALTPAPRGARRGRRRRGTRRDFSLHRYAVPTNEYMQNHVSLVDGVRNPSRAALASTAASATRSWRAGRCRVVRKPLGGVLAGDCLEDRGARLGRREGQPARATAQDHGLRQSWASLGTRPRIRPHWAIGHELPEVVRGRDHGGGHPALGRPCWPTPGPFAPGRAPCVGRGPPARGRVRGDFQASRGRRRRRPVSHPRVATGTPAPTSARPIGSVGAGGWRHPRDRPVSPGRSERARRRRPRGGRSAPEPGTDRQPSPQTLEPAQAPKAQHEEDEAKARPRDSVREALEPCQRPSGLRGRRSVWPTNRFHHARRDRVREARCDGRPRVPRGPEGGGKRCHCGYVSIDVGGAVPEDLTCDFASGTKAEQPAQRRRAGVEADRHAAKRLEESTSCARAVSARRSGAPSGSASSDATVSADPTRHPGDDQSIRTPVRGWAGERAHARRWPPSPRGVRTTTSARAWLKRQPAYAAPRARLLVHGVPEDRGRDVEVGPGIEQVLRPKPEHPTPNRIVDLREPDVRRANSSQERPPPRGSAGIRRHPQCSAPRVGPHFRPRPPIPRAPGRSRPRPPPSPQFPRGLQAVPVQRLLARRDNHDRRGNRQGGASSA